jgi:hypothetical protein
LRPPLRLPRSIFLLLITRAALQLAEASRAVYNRLYSDDVDKVVPSIRQRRITDPNETARSPGAVRETAWRNCELESTAQSPDRLIRVHPGPNPFSRVRRGEGEDRDHDRASNRCTKGKRWGRLRGGGTRQDGEEERSQGK